MNNRKLCIPLENWQSMQREAASSVPEEACGLLAGRDCRVSKHYPIENELHSPIRFRMEPQSQLEAFLSMDKLGIELLAYYHSHPKGGAEPSSTDLAEFLYPEVAMLIWYQIDGVWQANAWDIQGTIFLPIILEIIE